MNKTINKSKVLLLAAGGLLSCSILFAPVANASDPQKADVREYMYDIGYWYRRKIDKLPVSFVEKYTKQDRDRYDRTPITITHTSVEQMGDISYKEAKFVEVKDSSSTLENTLKDQELTLHTIGTDYTSEETISNSVTHGTKFNTEVSAKFNVAIAELNTKFSLEYNYANTKTNTQKNSVTYKVPSQTIKVPAGKTYKATTLLKVGTATGKVYLNTEFNGPDYKIQNAPILPKGTNTNFNMGFAKTVQRMSLGQNPYIPETTGTIRHLGGNKFKAVGYGDFEIEYSTDFYIRVDDITPDSKRSRSLIKKPKTVATYKIPASQIETIAH